MQKPKSLQKSDAVIRALSIDFFLSIVYDNACSQMITAVVKEKTRLIPRAECAGAARRCLTDISGGGFFRRSGERHEKDMDQDMDIERWTQSFGRPV